jgi:hypothetical protein
MTKIRYSDTSAKEDKVVIEIMEGDFKGVKYTLGEVSFPDEDEPVLSFHYDIIEGIVDDLPAFEKFVGDQLVIMIEQTLRDKTIVFKGGV